jgi:hypothetical protein
MECQAKQPLLIAAHDSVIDVEQRILLDGSVEADTEDIAVLADGVMTTNSVIGEEDQR